MALRITRYLESRGSEREWDSTLFFGLQYILKEYFANPISYEEFYEAAALVPQHCPFASAPSRKVPSCRPATL